LHWAGGKSWLIKHLEIIIGDLKFNHYHEPFLGGAAIFFSMEHKKKSYLSDINSDLIDTYIAVRDQPQKVINKLLEFNNSKDDYYLIRGGTFCDIAERAAQFIYLNQTSYNGLYRVNKLGKYNVPYGFRKNWEYNIQRINEASIVLKQANIKFGDFETNKYKIQRGDLIFIDPPYTVSHNNNGFIEYNKNLFSLQDQYRLSKYIDFIKIKPLLLCETVYGGSRKTRSLGFILYLLAAKSLHRILTF
jgi:DNA adenine methylase